MPLHDWQFWVVTLLMLWGLWVLLRAIVPARRKAGDADPSCPNCASGEAASQGPRRVSLTIERKKL